MFIYKVVWTHKENTEIGFTQLQHVHISLNSFNENNVGTQKIHLIVMVLFE